MRIEDVKVVENEIKITEERLNILKSIRDSKLDIELLKQNRFFYNKTDYTIVDGMIVHNGYVNSSKFFPICIVIKENNMNYVSFDEYIAYASRINLMLSSETTYKKIEDHILESYKEVTKSARVFEKRKIYVTDRANKEKQKEITSIKCSFKLNIINGKVEFFAFVSFFANLDSSYYAALSTKLSLSINESEDCIVINNDPKDPKAIFEQ